MDKREKAAERARQEDAILNRVLIWIAGSVVLEALLLLLNRYYVEYTMEEVFIAKGIYDATGVLSFVFPICFVVALIWWVAAHRRGRKTLAPQIVTTVLAILSVCAIFCHFFVESGVKVLCVAVPCVAVLALVYYLYQHEFFVVTLTGAAGLLGLWMLSKRGGIYSPLVYAYLIVELVVLVAAILMTRHLQDNQGSLRLKGGSVQCFPGNANYILLYLTFLVSVLVQAVGLLLGPVPVLYAVEIVWLLAMAVYYTVRLM